MTKLPGRPSTPQPIRPRTPQQQPEMPVFRPQPGTYAQHVPARAGQPQTSAPRGAVPVRFRPGYGR